MNRKILLAAVLAVFAVQLAIPASLVVKCLRLEAQGTELRFRCAPIDPADPLRGRYVRLNFESSTAFDEWPDGLERGEIAYATLEVDEDGFATVNALSESRPSAGLYLKVHATWGHRIVLPFARYYLNEHDAPRAENLYREALGKQEAYAVVHVDDGDAVLTGLILGERPIEEWLAEGPEPTAAAEPVPVPTAESDTTQGGESEGGAATN